MKGLTELFPAKMIGPMVPSSYLDGRIKGDKGYGAILWKPLTEECSNWLESKPPQSVVYISFGSMVSLTEEQMEEVAWGLKESGVSFLWVLRESEHGKLPCGYRESVKDKGLIVTWCNQLELLAHQATGCFVTHCGWNSTLESLSLGVPVVCLPQWADQLPDAKFLDEIWDVGVWPKEDEKGIVRIFSIFFFFANHLTTLFSDFTNEKVNISLSSCQLQTATDFNRNNLPFSNQGINYLIYRVHEQFI